MKVILALLISVTFSLQANAQSQSQVEAQGMQAALDARDNFVQQLQKKEFTQIAHDAFDHAIQNMIQEMLDRNDPDMAQELSDHWNQSEGVFFSGALTMGLLDLGDHDPLFPWLEGYFNKLSLKYGSIILNLPIVQDLRTMNFAIPVVFNPHGKWQSKDYDNRIEYRKHFIPFANIVTYYVSLYGCTYEIKKHGMGQLKKICEMAADKLKFAMGRYIAPVVSDWIFKASNRQLKLGDSQLRYTNVDELREAVQSGNLY